MDSPQPPTPAVQAGKHKVAITDFTIRIPGSNRRIVDGAAGEPGPSRWRSREFMGYYVAFAVVVPMMVRIPAKLSSSEFPHCLPPSRCT